VLLLPAVPLEGARSRSSSITPITDKTLVAWVYPANLDQRGGSLLTLIDREERFDAIVLGEIERGRWMAGSDFFRRTERNQSAYPRETENSLRGNPRTPVQVAITYRGREVSIFRNGKPYAAYQIARPQSFGQDARDVTVLIGLRYVGAGGTVGYFAGAIEDARIYDRALDAAAIAALRPDRPSTPEPIGWWTFEGGSTGDSMKNFPPGELCGGARIEDGKLILNGTDAYLICESNVEDNQLLFYKARSRQTGNMWDTWLYDHRGIHHLFYLARRGPRWDNISMATSPDGVHWKELGPILEKGEGVTWMGTGSTWKSPRHEEEGKFYLNFSEWRGPRQTIFFAESTDLIHWKRLGDELEFRQDTRWYRENGRWDCIYTIPRPGGGLYGYWTATPKARGRFGFGRSLDGVRWEALEPPETPGVGEGEVGAVEKIGGRYYLMFGTGGIMVTLVGERPEGPFRPAEKNYRLLSGHTYFSRFYPTHLGLLANHHSIARNGQVYMGTLKTATLDAGGTLRLGWWRGNDRLKLDAQKVEMVAAGKGGGSPVLLLEPVLDTGAGAILEGTLHLSREGKPAGIYIEHGEGRGSAILIGPGGVAELGSIRPDGSGFRVEKRVDRQMDSGEMPSFRLLLKHSLLEFYLRDVLMECFSLPGRATGRIGLIRGRDREERPKSWRAWQLPP